MQSLQKDINLQVQHMVEMLKNVMGIDVKADLLKRVLNMFDAPCEDAKLSNVTSAFWIVLQPVSSTYQAPTTTFSSDYDVVLRLLGTIHLDVTSADWLPTVLSLLQSISCIVDTSQIKQLGPIMRFLVNLLFEKDVGDEKGNFLLRLMCRETLWKVQERFGNAFLDGKYPFNSFSGRLKNSELWFLKDAIMDGLHRRHHTVTNHLKMSCGTCFHSFEVDPGYEIGLLSMKNSRYFLVLDLKCHSVLLVSKRLAQIDATNWPRGDLLIVDPHKKEKFLRRLRNPPSATAFWWQLNLISS